MIFLNYCFDKIEDQKDICIFSFKLEKLDIKIELKLCAILNVCIQNIILYFVIFVPNFTNRQRRKSISALICMLKPK